MNDKRLKVPDPLSDGRGLRHQSVEPVKIGVLPRVQVSVAQCSMVRQVTMGPINTNGCFTPLVVIDEGVDPFPNDLF